MISDTSSACSRNFQPGASSRGGDWRWDFLGHRITRVKALEEAGESAMRASLANGMPHGFEVGVTVCSQIKRPNVGRTAIPFV